MLVAAEDRDELVSIWENSAGLTICNWMASEGQASGAKVPILWEDMAPVIKELTARFERHLQE